MSDNESGCPPPVADSIRSHIKGVAANLECPAQSAKFLEVYHKSAVKVEQLAGSLRRVSLCFGAVAGFFFFVATFSMLYSASSNNDVIR